MGPEPTRPIPSDPLGGGYTKKFEIIRVIYQITLAFDAEYESDVILTLTFNPTRYPIPSEGKNYKKGQKLQKIEIIRVIYQITLDFDAE